MAPTETLASFFVGCVKGYTIHSSLKVVVEDIIEFFEVGPIRAVGAKGAVYLILPSEYPWSLVSKRGGINAKWVL